jgi:SAM-dependent methyltransferase
VEADLDAFAAGVEGWAGSGSPDVLILGVTPELHALAARSSTKITAVDASEAMIAAVWPGEASAARTGSWTDLPVDANSQDLVLCDGGLGTLPDATLQTAVLAEVHRVLRPGGRFVVRLFAPIDEPDGTNTVRHDLDAGLIPSLDALKLRLWSALSAGGEVRPQAVVAWIREAAGSWEALAESRGWSSEHCASLALHQDSDAVYRLLDAEALLAAAVTAGFDPVSVDHPAHAFGDSCPVVTLSRT